MTIADDGDGRRPSTTASVGLGDGRRTTRRSRPGAVDRAGAAAGAGRASGRPADRHGAGGSGLRTGRTGGLASWSASQARDERGHVCPIAACEGLVVGASVGVRADQADQGVLAVGPDQEVDRGHALGVREARTVSRSSGTARSGPVSGMSVPSLGGALDVAPVARGP